MNGYNPEFTWNVENDVPEEEAPAACKRAAAIMVKRETMKDQLRHVVEYQAKCGELAAPPPAILMGGEEEYEVEAILDKRQWRGKTQYLVK
ncbi:MAG: hypothetical protein M1840_001522 [Geoglossum simile]|nr:MAG: hypothetical protein M1840_001522 [Geoglossum simile]